jgi:oligosaccharide repeat unit polymerase
MLYGLQLIGAIWDPYHVYEISQTTVLFFNLQNLFLIIGASVALNKYKVREYDLSSIFNIRINKLILFLQTGFLLLSYVRYQKMSSFLLKASLTSEARAYYYTEFYSSYTEQLLNYFADAFIYISYFFAFGLLFFSKRRLGFKEIYIIVTTFVIAVLKGLTSFGRGDIFRIIIVYLLFFLVSACFDKKSFKKRTLPSAFIFLGIVGVGLVLTTIVRYNLGNAESFGGQIEELIIQPFATYFYVPVCAFEYGSNYIFDDLVPMLGAADFAGFVDFVFTPFKYFDHNFYSPNSILGQKMSPGFAFPSGLGWNALFTGASNYYIDFGFLGFIIFPFIHGYLLTFIGYKARRNGTWFLVFLFLFMSSYIHMTSSGIQSMSTMFVFVWIYIMSKTKSIT